jgi:hypothetical protein
MDDLCLFRHCVARRHHVELVPFAWIRHHGQLPIVAAHLYGQRHGFIPSCLRFHV